MEAIITLRLGVRALTLTPNPDVMVASLWGLGFTFVYKKAPSFFMGPLCSYSIL